ncbi:MAG: ChaN family lipoprotein [Sulfurovum sp.]|nr:ChaN family lipoprotein [Sulfurovum sp.]
MLKYIKIISIVAIVLILSACSTKKLVTVPQQSGIYSVKQDRIITVKELTKEVEKYSVIFVGDHHNTKPTHKFFNKFLKSLAKKGYRIHLANEWFTPEHNRVLKLYTDGKISSNTLKHKRKWSKFTSMDWNLVSALYRTVRESGGRLYGVNLSKKKRSKISLRQIDKMNKEERAFYERLDLGVKAHRNLVMPFFKHCHMMPKKSNEPCEERMYRVQVSWDTYMAEQSAKIAQKALKSKKDKLIIFAGAMHVEQGLGIPLRFSRLNNLPSYIITNHRNSKKPVDSKKADALFIYNSK